MDLADDVGNFFQAYDMYLQDPRGCTHDVKYVNPQRLSAVDLATCQTTWSLQTSDPLLGSAIIQDSTKRPDVLDILDSSQDLPEAAQPDAVQTQLKK